VVHFEGVKHKALNRNSLLLIARVCNDSATKVTGIRVVDACQGGWSKEGLTVRTFGVREAAFVFGTVGGKLLIILFPEFGDIERNIVRKATLAGGSVEFECALKDGAEGTEVTEVGDEFEAGEEREAGEGVRRDVFAQSERNSHWGTVGHLVGVQ